MKKTTKIGRPRGPGRPLGPKKNTRTTCRYCQKALIESDPKRLSRYGMIWTGACAACTSDYIVIKKWRKKGYEAILNRMTQLRRELEILDKALMNEQKGEKP